MVRQTHIRHVPRDRDEEVLEALRMRRDGVSVQDISQRQRVPVSTLYKSFSEIIQADQAYDAADFDRASYR